MAATTAGPGPNQIPSLSYSTPLAAGGTQLTTLVDVRQWAILHTSIIADTPTTVVYEFSADGIFFDCPVSIAAEANVATKLSSNVLAQFVQMTITNDDQLTAQTVLRVNTYGDTRATASATASGGGNGASSLANFGSGVGESNAFLVDGLVTTYVGDFNQFQEIPVLNDATGDGENIITDTDYMQVWTRNTVVNPGSILQSPDSGLRLSAPISDVASVGRLAMINTSRWMKHSSMGVTSIIFSARFHPYDALGEFSQILMIGQGDINGILNGADYSNRSFAAFGYFEFQQASPQLEIVFSDGRGGSVVSVRQANWNVDPADGTKTLPALDATTMNLTYRILVFYSGNGRVVYQIMNPGTSTFVTVHNYIPSNPQPRLFERNCLRGMCLIDNRPVIPAAPTDYYIDLTHMCTQHSNQALTGLCHQLQSGVYGQSPVPVGESIAWRSQRFENTYLTQRNTTNCYLRNLSFVFTWTGGGQVPPGYIRINVLRRTGQNAITGGSWGYVSQNVVPDTPLQNNITFTGATGPAHVVVQRIYPTETPFSTLSASETFTNEENPQFIPRDLILAPGEIMTLNLLIFGSPIADWDYDLAYEFGTF